MKLLQLYSKDTPKYRGAKYTEIFIIYRDKPDIWAITNGSKTLKQQKHIKNVPRYKRVMK